MPKDGDVFVNEYGGRQSYVSTRLDLIPPENLLLLGQCLGWGAKEYGEHNWHQIPLNENLNHALVHLIEWMKGDRSEPHLVNAIARINFALWHAIQDGSQPLSYIHPRMKVEATEDADDDSTNVLIEEEETGIDFQPPKTKFFHTTDSIEHIQRGQTDKT
jgi:hypothetical protein